jgi:rhodanese-related sulfurtransferase
MKNHSPRFLKIANDAQANVKHCSIDDVRTQLNDNDDFTLIDVREESEYAAGKIPSAVHLSKGIIERDIEKTIPETERKIVLYCGGGFRSAMAAENLQKMGYENVYSMDGGWTAWKNAGHPTE